jgi:hypothetical protein
VKQFRALDEVVSRIVRMAVRRPYRSILFSADLSSFFAHVAPHIIVLIEDVHRNLPVLLLRVNRTLESRAILAFDL